jgi:predicted nucleic acid-binding Zn ribbon protein
VAIKTADDLCVEEEMFCDACGTAVQPGQAFCGKCGKQIVGPVTAMQQRAGRVESHLHLLGILWLAISAFNTIGAVVLYIVANTLFAHLHDFGAPPEAPTGFLRPLLSVIAIFILAKAALGFIAGWGLMQREPWARVLALVLGLISLFNIPFGTIVGVYTLWVLLPAQSQQEYESIATPSAA